MAYANQHQKMTQAKTATAPEASGQKILVLDFGSQLSQLIARRVRNLGVYCQLIAADSSAETIRAAQPSGIILSGSQLSVYTPEALKPDKAIFELGIPILAICYGMQVMAHMLGGKVEASSKREFGAATVRARGHSQLLRDIQDASNAEGHGLLHVWMSHSDKVRELPPGYKVIGSSAACAIAAMADEQRKIYALQFHPELRHTRSGTAIIQRFVYDICACRDDWRMTNFIPSAIARVRAQVGSDQVVMAVSGGVDSTVSAALLQRAIGKQLHCIFIDNGLLRQGEREQVEKLLADQLGVDLISVDASERFLQALSSVSDPEQKRKIIGAEFIGVFQQQAQLINNARWLAQGTIYPDVIESGQANTSKASAIKSHHNVGGLPADMGLKLLEPLRDLFKDEVRALGRELGLPDELINRQPFPGPGLAVRVLGTIDRQRLDMLRQADAIFLHELQSLPAATTSQAFAVFLPVRSVGVMGDDRSYQHCIALRAVSTEDFMSAECADLPISFLKRVAARIVNEVVGINRVVYDLSSKPPATIEWE